MNTQLNEGLVYRSQVRRIALSLSVACQIPNGEALIAILCTGSERSNQDALEHWVSQHMHIVEEAAEPRVILEKLKYLLIDEIMALQHN